jgi:predicted RND superfamily exporter protein
MTSALLITLVVGGIWTSGLAALTVGGLNLISVAFMVLFFGLGVDFGTHLGLRYLELRREGADFQDAMRRSMVGEAPSITLSALAAALAFLSFVPTSYVGLAEFGIISALGMLVALVLTFTVLPALMAVMRPVPSPRAPRHIGLGPFISKHYRAILVVAGLATVAAGWAATHARSTRIP